jgi:hypothetical protein
VKVSAEGNPGLYISSASPPSLSKQRCTIEFFWLWRCYYFVFM